MVQARIYHAQFVLGLAFLGLGVWLLAAGRSGMGIFYLALAGGWMLIGFLSRRRRRSRPSSASHDAESFGA